MDEKTDKSLKDRLEDARRFLRLKTNEISIVDHPANLREFLIIKKLEDERMTSTEDKLDDTEVEKSDGASSQAASEDSKVTVEDICKSELFDFVEVDTEKALPLHLVESIKSITPIFEQLRNEAEETVQKSISTVLQFLGAVTSGSYPNVKKEEENVVKNDDAVAASSSDTSSVASDAETDIEKAMWDTKYVNDLPDSAFLYVESGGEKDADGKTVPRSLRHFPFKNADGKVDLPHLRNAIARIPQSNAPGLTPEKKSQLQEKARTMLEKEKQVEKSDNSDSSANNMAEIQKELADLREVVKGIQEKDTKTASEEKASDSNKEDANISSEVTKAQDNASTQVQDSPPAWAVQFQETISKSVEDLKKSVSDQAKKIETIEKSRKPSASLENEGGNDNVNEVKKSFWSGIF